MALVIWLLAGCGATSNSEDESEGTADVTVSGELSPGPRVGTIWQPAPGTSWQWQLSGTLVDSWDVGMYDIDLVNTSAAQIAALQADDRIVICYFSAGSWEEGRPDAADFPDAVVGKVMDGWPDERWLDISALDELGPIMEARLDLAVDKGCDGVEPDNVDGYDNDSGFPLTGADQLAYNRWLADEAHARGLSIGLKNDLPQIPALLPWFDWAINEQCFEMEECEELVPFVAAGKAVFGVEYNLDAEEFCDEANALDFDWLAMDLDLAGDRIACR